MKRDPIICFYGPGQFLVSFEYECVALSKFDWINELREYGTRNRETIKIVALSFESGYGLHALDLPVGESYLFILKTHKVLGQADLAVWLSEFSVQNFEFNGVIPSLDYRIFEKKLQRIHEAIGLGQVYQVNYTFPFKGVYSGSALSLFQHYQNQFSGDFHAFLPLESSTFLCFSPELFLEKKGDRLLSRPIKGTCLPDRNSIQNLLSSEKEHAELSMIVDLMRNDLHRVTSRGEAQVNFHRRMMDLGDLAHTYSEIEVQTTMQLPDILERTFPGGSISGCPKKAALKLIAELETSPRGLYTGSLGWWQGDRFCLNIAIRSMILRADGSLEYHAGGGIVYDSISENEYREALLKSARLVTS